MTERPTLDAAHVEPVPTAPVTVAGNEAIGSAVAPSDGPDAPDGPRIGPPTTLRTRQRAARGLVAALGAAVVGASIFVAGVGFDRTGVLPGSPAAAVTQSPNPDEALITQAWDLLHEKYVGAATLDDKKLAYGAIDGMTQAVGDEGHTTFLTPEELASSQASLSGSYAGIGAEMDTTGDQPIVVGVFHDSPADRAGLRRGDVVTAVDGTPTKGTPLDAVISSVRGPAGTSVELTVTREGTANPITFHIVRAEVTIPSVDWAWVPGTRVADIRIEQFSNGAADIFKTTLADAVGQGATGVILDLRGNPGGYVNEAVGVASQFLTSGTVYIQRDASGKEVPTPVSSGGVAPKVPVVVLVDHGTASSAEIVTGALQDAGRATVVGERTFGTGTVLGKFDLADGSALRIGTVEWLTPKGRRIWHEGLVPDVAVTLPTSVQPVLPHDLAALGTAGLAKLQDAQLAKAIDILSGKMPA
jgi:carboxyl-terminal processing protease